MGNPLGASHILRFFLNRVDFCLPIPHTYYMNTNADFQAGFDAYNAGEDESILHGKSAAFDRGFWAAHDEAGREAIAPECLDSHMGDCEGMVEYRPAMSPSGKSFPRCAGHFEARLVTQERLSRDYGVPMFY